MSDPAFQLDPEDLRRFLKTVDKKIGTLGLASGRIPRAMRSVAEIWMTESKNRTPMKFGTLRSSGHVVGPVVSGKNVTVHLVFGGPAAPYAGIVHENLNARHNVGQAKYLESVVAEHRPTFLQEMFTFMGST